MNKIIIISADCLSTLSNDDIKLLTEGQISKGNKVVIMAREQRKVTDWKKKLSTIIPVDALENKLFFYTRYFMKSLMESNRDKSNYCIIIGTKNVDLEFAAPKKLLLLVPTWHAPIEEKPDKYGIKIETVKKMDMVINIINNQNNWFYRLDLDDKCTILSLTDANHFANYAEELKMISGFKAVLKFGNKRFFYTLLYHFLAAISNNSEFRDVSIWSVFPSSGTELNEDMVEFKEKARLLMYSRSSEPLFIRYTATYKSHYNQSTRLFCDRHFDTIILNEAYKNKLRGKTVCIFDDYCTNGTSFEVARNLLLKEEVKKIFLVSLGKFHKNSINQYCIQNFSISGDVYKAGYSYNLIDSMWKEGIFNSDAKNEVRELHRIIYE